MRSMLIERFCATRSVAALGGGLFFLLGCAGGPGESAGDGFEEAATESVQSAVTAGGCIAPASDYANVGQSYNALTGAYGSFAFAMDNAGYYPACQTVPQSAVALDEAFVSTREELVQFVSKSYTGETSVNYGGFHSDASVEDVLSRGSTFSNNEILYVVRRSQAVKTVTLMAEAKLSDNFVSLHNAGLCAPGSVGCENGVPVHNEYGDVFEKSAILGNRMFVALHAKITEGTKYSKEKFQAAVKANYEKVFGVDGKVVTATELAEMNSKMLIRVQAAYQTAEAIAPRDNLTLDGVKATVAAFDAQVAKGFVLPNGQPNYVQIGAQLGSFSDRTDGRINLAAGSFPWRARAQAIAKDRTYLALGDAIANTGTTVFGLNLWASEMQAGIPWHIELEQDASQLAPDWNDWTYYAWIEGQYNNYKAAVNKSYKFQAWRAQTTCMGTPGSDISTGTGMVAEPCSGPTSGNSDDQLFQYNATTGNLMTLDGNCVGVAGVGATSGVMAIETCSAADKDQSWITGARRNVKVGATSYRDVQTWSNATNAAAFYIKADALSQAGSPMRLAGWSRSEYAKYDWFLTK